MTEYRIDFNESKLASISIPANLISVMRDQGEIREIIKDQRYYWTPKENVEQIIDLFSEYRGVTITKLQGNLLR
jgi:DNA-directed RNA polymerase subunit F